jgi:hypothetical protein
MIDVPHTVAAVLDLLPPHVISAAIEYQSTCGDTLDDWEAKHLLAADYLCSYAEMTYPRRYEKQVARLRKKLQIMADYECV